LKLGFSAYYKDFSELSGAQSRHQPIVFACFYLSIDSVATLFCLGKVPEGVLPCPALSHKIGWIFRGIRIAGYQQAYIRIYEVPFGWETLRWRWALVGGA
jgi:hypothetical protein